LSRCDKSEVEGSGVRENTGASKSLPLQGKVGRPQVGSDEVGPPAVTMVYALPHRRTTSSVFGKTMQAFFAGSTFP